MTREKFKKLAKEKGFDRYKEYLESLGFSKRYLDRTKDNEVIPKKLLTLLEDITSKEQNTIKTPLKQEPQHIEPTIIKTPNNESIGLTVTNEDYHASSRLGSSKIKMIFDNALKYKKVYLDKDVKQKSTDALLIGSLFHTLVLEPHMLSEEYIILDMPTRTRPLKKDYINAIIDLGGEPMGTVEILKEDYEKLKKECGKTVVTKSHYETALALSKKALESRFVIESFNQITGEFKEKINISIETLLNTEYAHVERTFYGAIDGVEVQVRPDILVTMPNGTNFVIDLKSITESLTDRFEREMSERYYDWQEYIYREVLVQNGIKITKNGFRFLTAGKDEFTDYSYFVINPADIEDAGKAVSKVLAKYKYSLKNNEWSSRNFDYVNMRYETTTIVNVKVYRKHKDFGMGV